jgi:hypothetical protein
MPPPLANDHRRQTGTSTVYVILRRYSRCIVSYRLCFARTAGCRSLAVDIAFGAARVTCPSLVEKRLAITPKTKAGVRGVRRLVSPCEKRCSVKLRAPLSQVFFSVRSRCWLVAQIDYNLLFRWSVALGMDDAVWNHAMVSKNRYRLLRSEVAQDFFADFSRRAKRFVSDDGFTVFVSLIQIRVRGLGHAPVENRNGLIAAAMATMADCSAERETALLMLNDQRQRRKRRITVGADKAYDSRGFVAAVRNLNVILHVTKIDTTRRSNLDCRTTRHTGFASRLNRRWLVEKAFGWLKQTGPSAKSNCEVCTMWTGCSSSVARHTPYANCQGGWLRARGEGPGRTAPKSAEHLADDPQRSANRAKKTHSNRI